MSYLKDVKHPADFANFKLKHILRKLSFLKNYPLRTTVALTLGVSEPTFDKYVWYGIKLISEIDNISNWLFLITNYYTYIFILSDSIHG